MKIMFQTIECAQLDFNDTTFLMSYPREALQVLASVRTIGVLQPIVVSDAPHQGKYQIIAGFRRAYACRAIGLDRIRATMYPLGPDNALGAFRLALYENLAHRTFNDVEKSLILTKLLRQFACSQDEVIQTYMPLLRLAPNAKVLETYLKIHDFEEEIKHYMADHEFPMTVSELLATLSSDDRQAVFRLISTLRLGINKIKELLTHLEEIALRDNCTMKQIIDDRQIHDILRHKQYTGPQKAEQIRRIIREKRYPQLTTLEHKYHDQLKQLHLPRGLQLKTDRFFEDDDLSATFRFQTPEQLRTVAEVLLEISQKPELQYLLNLVQGKER